MATVVKLASNGPSREHKQALLECVNDLKIEIEEGRINEICGIAFNQSSYTYFGVTGGVTGSSRHHRAGVFMDLAMHEINK